MTEINQHKQRINTIQKRIEKLDAPCSLPSDDMSFAPSEDEKKMLKFWEDEIVEYLKRPHDDTGSKAPTLPEQEERKDDE